MLWSDFGDERDGLSSDRQRRRSDAIIRRFNSTVGIVAKLESIQLKTMRTASRNSVATGILSESDNRNFMDNNPRNNRQKHDSPSLQAVLPYLGFYPKILGIFKCDGIFLGIFFAKDTLGKIL